MEEEAVDSNSKENAAPTLEEISLTPDDLMAELIKATATHSALKDNFMDNFVFDDASLSEWSARLRIVIPEDPTPEDMRNLWVSLTRKLQVAGHYHSIASSISNALTGGGNLKKADVIAAIVNQYRIRNAKRPAKDIIDQMANSYLSDTVSANTAATVVKNFWKHRLDLLIEMRKCLEQMSIGMHVEKKWSNE